MVTLQMTGQNGVVDNEKQPLAAACGSGGKRRNRHAQRARAAG
jgi:hypothetical protein